MRESFLRKLQWRAIKKRRTFQTYPYVGIFVVDLIKNLNSHIKMYDTTLMFKQFFSHLNIKIKYI
jgi:hypothetical protein